MKRKDHLPNVKKTNVFLSYFSSLKLTIALLFFIVLLSIAGSIIPQQEAFIEFIRHLPAGWAAALQKMQFFDLYHSIWFFLLLGLLSLNLVVCSLNRFPVTWKAYQAKAFPEAFTSLENLPAPLTLMTEERRERALQRMEALLAREYRKTEKRETGQGTFLHAEKGRFSLFGIYIVHLSILIIIAGAVVGSIFGFNSFIKMAEGDSIDTIHLKDNRGEKKLNFSIRCDRFSVNYYEDGLPREYRSDLTFLKNDHVAYHGSLRVNHPITFEGIRFYQASHGTMSGGRIGLTIRKEGGKEQRDIFSLDHIDRKYYTGLQIAYDPGIPIVATGAFLLFAGFMVVFFSSHRQIWIEVDTHGDHTRIRLAGKTSRDPRRMQRELELLMDLYKNSGDGV